MSAFTTLVVLTGKRRDGSLLCDRLSVQNRRLGSRKGNSTILGGCESSAWVLWVVEMILAPMVLVSCDPVPLSNLTQSSKISLWVLDVENAS